MLLIQVIKDKVGRIVSMRLDGSDPQDFTRSIRRSYNWLLHRVKRNVPTEIRPAWLRRTGRISAGDSL